MPSGEDDEIVARCGPLLGFGEALVGARLLVELFAGRLASERFLGELFTATFVFRELLAGRTFLE